MASKLSRPTSSRSKVGCNTRTYQDSPPSLVFSDLTSEDSEDTMEDANDREDVSTVMTKVLAHLERVVEHLREKGENEAANRIAKDAISMVNTFNDATAPWDIDKCLMKSARPRTDQSTPRTDMRADHSRTVNNGSWAAVAAAAIENDPCLVKFRPHDALKQQVSDGPSKPDEKDLRVVWIQGWQQTRPLSEVTERLRSGALFSMAYSEENNAVCIIFQHAVAARLFLDDHAYSSRATGISVFGRTCQVVAGRPYPEDEDIRRMGPPWNERRRLTFVRQQLFNHGMTEEQFKKDIFALVGECNVELVWLFNTGNATVVFTATPIARLVRDEFRKRSKMAGPYKDVQVSFSHDPCERSINLTTQLPVSQPSDRTHSDKTPPDTESYNPNRTRLGGPGPSSAASGSMAEADGWQTVARKR